MLNRAARTLSVSLFALGGLVAFAPASPAQETTTTIAAVADTAAAAAPVAESTVAPVADAAAPPVGGVAAGGGFLSDDGNNALPIVLGVGALVAGAGFVVSRRRKA